MKKGKGGHRTTASGKTRTRSARRVGPPLRPRSPTKPLDLSWHRSCERRGVDPILDPITFPFHLPQAQALERTLYTFMPRTGAIKATLQRAGISAALIHFDQPAYLVWHEALAVAAVKGKTRALLAAAREEPAYGEAIGQRLEEILGATPVLAIKSPDPVVWRNNEVRTGDAKQFLSAMFLRRGAELAVSVVRLAVEVVSGSFSETSVGTGFLIQPDLVLSNHHVLFPNKQSAAKVTVRFDYDLNLDTSPTPYDDVVGISGSIEGNPEHDWAVVRLEQPVSRSWIDLTPGAAQVDACAYIIQHPAGGAKMVALHNNTIRFADGEVVQYLTDTLPGSSGSPVFNNRWEIIALHHQSIAVNVGSRREIRNEGIAIARVRDGLIQRGLLS